jgi:hypothetical protein
MSKPESYQMPMWGQCLLVIAGIGLAISMFWGLNQLGAEERAKAQACFARGFDYAWLQLDHREWACYRVEQVK